MRILHVVYTPRFSGAEILVSALTEVHASMGHASRVVSLNPPEDNFFPVIKNQAVSHGVEWVSPTVPLSKISRLLFVRRAKARFQPDVIFAHSAVPAAYARMAFSRRVITVLHGGHDYKSRYFLWPELLLQYRTSGVIAVSEIARQRYAERFSHPRTRHIPNGIAIANFQVPSAKRSAIRERLGFGEDDFIALQVGRISKGKQQHLSIRALAPIIAETPRAHLLILGFIEDHDYLLFLHATIKDAGIEHGVHFLGARNDVAETLCAADVFLMPSTMEAHSVALIEALVSGLPVIASAIPSFQFAEAYEGVTLVAPDNIPRVTALIRATMSQPRRYCRDLSHMNIETTARAYLSFADECTSGSRRAGESSQAW